MVVTGNLDHTTSVCACVCHCIARREAKSRLRFESTSFFSLNRTGLLSSSQSLYFLTLALIDEVFVDGGGDEGRKDQYHRHPPRFLNYLGC